MIPLERSLLRSLSGLSWAPMYLKTDLIDGKGTAPQGAVVCGHQMETLSSGARYMPSPSVTPNVSMNFLNC